MSQNRLYEGAWREGVWVGYSLFFQQTYCGICLTMYASRSLSHTLNCHNLSFEIPNPIHFYWQEREENERNTEESESRKKNVNLGGIAFICQPFFSSFPPSPVYNTEVFRCLRKLPTWFLHPFPSFHLFLAAFFLPHFFKSVHPLFWMITNKYFMTTS